MATKNLLVFVALVVVVVLSPCNALIRVLEKDAICEDVNACFEYCENFVDGITGLPTRECCDNLMILNGKVKYEDDGVRRYCSCIVDFSNSHYHPPYLQSRIEQLYLICDIHLSFPISEHMDCSKL
ncbi:non-specific lipid-transfer protein 13-like [Lycium ferocissimum]|uniref:non-specific lipid-transfer protein 13-like n=1 Tax=Lycium ferocissimum TaxID=112874 RepID=UPI002815939F|nr:non-specific lipid-transfer protein 13-like [Lycium ferocissimum]